jgi:hypothetical protein
MRRCATLTIACWVVLLGSIAAGPAQAGRLWEAIPRPGGQVWVAKAAPVELGGAAVPPLPQKQARPQGGAAEGSQPLQLDGAFVAPGQTAAVGTTRTNAEVFLSIGVLAFGLSALGLEAVLMLRQNRLWSEQSFRVFGLTLVITSGLFLLTTGFSGAHVAPMMALLGTVAGYILGREKSQDAEQRRAPEERKREER